MQSGGQGSVIKATKQVYSFSYWLSALVKGPSLAGENKTLREGLAAFQAKDAQIKVLTEENRRLRELATIPLPQSFTSLGVEVVGAIKDDIGERYLINRGKAHGLMPGMPLVAGINLKSGSPASALLVGIIKEVGPETASFTLTTSNATDVLSEIQNSQNSQGLASGEHNLAIRLKYIPLNDVVETGSQVTTSNLNELIPRGLLLGYVSAIDQRVGDFFKSAIVVPPQPLEKLQFLYILKR